MQAKLPDHWIIRELTERDYGIDAYVELVKPNGDVTGDVCSIQLKGTQSISWNAVETHGHAYTILHIPISTVNYWWNSPIPVFLVLADIGEQRAFFTPVKIQARVQHRIFKEEDSFPFFIHDNDELGVGSGQLNFLVQHIRERDHREFHLILRGIILHRREYLAFIQNQRLKMPSAVVESADELMLHHIYESCRFLSHYVDIEWKLPKLQAIYEAEKNIFPDSNRLHNQTLASFLADLEPVFTSIVCASREYILGPEVEYWFYNDLVLYRLCVELKQVELQSR